MLRSDPEHAARSPAGTTDGPAAGDRRLERTARGANLKVSCRKKGRSEGN